MEGIEIMSSNRKMHNKCALLFFILAWLFMFVLIVWAISEGNLDRLLLRSDDDGNICGIDVTVNNTNFKDKKYLLAMDYGNSSLAKWICVEKCPEETINTREELAAFAKKHNAHLCDYSVPMDQYSFTENSNKGPCPVLPLIKTKVLFNKCLPVIEKKKKKLSDPNTVVNVKAKDEYPLSQAAEDVKSTYGYIILIGGIVSAVFFLIAIAILPFLTTILVKVLLNILSLVYLAVCILCWVKYGQTNKGQKKKETTVEDQKLTEKLWDEEGPADDVFYTGIFFAIILVINVCVTYFLWSRLDFINAVLKQARSSLFSMPLLMLMPVIFDILILLVTCLFLYVFMGTVSIILLDLDKPRKINLATETVPFFGAQLPAPVLNLFYILLLTWTVDTLVALQHFSIAYPVASHFFNKTTQPTLCMAMTGILMGLRYHIGSIIMAALVNMLLRLVKIILEILEEKFRAGELGFLMAFFHCLVDKCGWVTKSLTNPTLSVIAIEGTPYCQALGRATGLIVSNIVKFGGVHLAFGIYSFIMISLISLTNAFIASSVFKPMNYVHNYLVPSGVVYIMSFMIGYIFFKVYESIITTMAICYCIVQTEMRNTQSKYFSANEILMYEGWKGNKEGASQKSKSADA